MSPRRASATGLRRPRAAWVEALAVVVLAAGAFLLGSAAGDRWRSHTAEWLLEWRAARGPRPHQGYRRQEAVPAAPAPASAAQEREIERLRTLAYLGATRPAGEVSGVSVHRRELVEPGWNLVVDTHGPEAVLMDMDGWVAHRWRQEFRAAFPASSIHRGAEGIQYWRRAALLADGGLLAIFEGAGLVRLDRESRLLWAFDEAAHHDLEVQADGTIYVLTREAAVRPEIDAERPVTEDWLVVLDAGGAVLRRVSILEAIRGSDFSSLLGRSEGHGDLLHTNTVEVLDGRLAGRLPAFADGNVLLSFPKLDTLAVLDPGRGEIVWSLTGMTSYQHEPTVLPSGRLLVFDNWGPLGRVVRDRRGAYSRVVEIDPESRRVEWSYADPDGEFYTECCGAAQRLANGNTLVTETDRGRAFEITRGGDVVWEFHTPHRVRDDGQELVARLFEVRRLDASAVSPWLPPN